MINPPEINAVELPQATPVPAEAPNPVERVTDAISVIEAAPNASTAVDLFTGFGSGQGVGAGIGGGLGPGISGGIGPGISGGLSQEAVIVQPQDPFATTIIRRPKPAPAVSAGWEQEEKSKTPVIPESELLSVLTDIVKRDSDPSVRNEALQGIYRMRSDAAIDSLIQLYDSIGDSKIKGEIIGYMLRRNGDNSKAIAKLVSIAKNEKDEELRNRAIRALGNLRTEDGAEHLIQIYDGLQDQKMKQYVIRSLSANKSRKAIDKLIQIAKNDSDPTIRQYAIRGLYGIDGRLYLELVDKARPGVSQNLFNFKTPDNIFRYNFDNYFNNPKLWNDLEQEWKFKLDENQEKIKELFEKFRIEDMDKLRFELPKIELRLKELEHEIDLGRHPGSLAPLEPQLKAQLSNIDQQLTILAKSLGETNAKVVQARATRAAMANNLKKLRSMEERIGVIQAKPGVKPARVSAYYVGEKTPRSIEQ